MSVVNTKKDIKLLQEGDPQMEINTVYNINDTVYFIQKASYDYESQIFSGLKKEYTVTKIRIEVEGQTTKINYDIQDSGEKIVQGVPEASLYADTTAAKTALNTKIDNFIDS